MEPCTGYEAPEFMAVQITGVGVDETDHDLVKKAVRQMEKDAGIDPSKTAGSTLWMTGAAMPSRERAAAEMLQYKEQTHDEVVWRLLRHPKCERVGAGSCAARWKLRVSGEDQVEQEVDLIIYPDPDDDDDAMSALALEAVLPSMTASTAEVRPAVIGATAARGTAITVIVRQLGRLPRAREAQARMRCLLEMQDALCATLSAAADETGAWTAAADPELLENAETETEEAVKFRIRRTAGDTVQAIPVSIMSTRGVWFLRVMPARAKQAVAAAIGTAASGARVAAGATIRGYHPCVGGMRQNHGSEEVCPGRLAARVGVVPVHATALWERIQANAHAQYGPMDTCPYYCAYSATRGRQAPCNPAENFASKRGCGAWMRQCMEAEPGAPLAGEGEAAMAQTGAEADEAYVPGKEVRSRKAGEDEAAAAARREAKPRSGSPRLERCACGQRVRAGQTCEECECAAKLEALRAVRRAMEAEESDADGSVMLVAGAEQQVPARGGATAQSADNEQTNGAMDTQPTQPAAPAQRPGDAGQAGTPQEARRRGKSTSPVAGSGGKLSGKPKKSKPAGGSSYAEVASRGKDDAHMDSVRHKKHQAALELQRRRQQDARNQVRGQARGRQ